MPCHFFLWLFAAAFCLTAQAAPGVGPGGPGWKVVRDTAEEEASPPPAAPPVGVGLVLSSKPGEAGVIARIVRDSPAADMGFKPGCVVEKIRGKPVTGMSAKAIAEALQGKAGTKVMVTVRYPGIDAVADYELERRPLVMPLRFTDDSDDKG